MKKSLCDKFDFKSKQKIKEIIADILDKRIEKITYAALGTVRGGKPNVEYATTKELELYDAIVKELKGGRCAVLL